MLYYTYTSPFIDVLIYTTSLINRHTIDKSTFAVLVKRHYYLDKSEIFGYVNSILINRVFNDPGDLFKLFNEVKIVANDNMSNFKSSLTIINNFN